MQFVHELVAMNRASAEAAGLGFWAVYSHHPQLFEHWTDRFIKIVAMTSLCDWVTPCVENRKAVFERWISFALK